MELIPTYLKDLQLELDALACRAPFLPSGLRRFFLLLLRAHWSHKGNWGPDLEDTLGCIEWQPDPESSPLNVELRGAPGIAQKQHEIWIEIGNYRFGKYGFGNRVDPSADNATELYALPCKCQLVVAHEAPTLDQAYNMAWSSFCFLLGFSEAIQEGLGPDTRAFSPDLIGEPQLEEPTPKSSFRVDVGAALDINLAVATTVESHRLKMVAVQPHTSSP